MALGLAAATANAMLDAMLRNVSYAGNAAIWVKLHVGDPGAAGANNAAANTTRQQGTFAAAASGVCSNSAAITWTNVPNAEDYTHASLWTASTAGTFLGSGTITANAVGVGDDFTMPIGDLDVSLTVAA